MKTLLKNEFFMKQAPSKFMEIIWIDHYLSVLYMLPERVKCANKAISLLHLPYIPNLKLGCFVCYLKIINTYAS